MNNNGETTGRLFQEHNEAPESDFDSFSPQEMTTIIYSPFAEECPIHIRPQIDATLLKQSPIFQIVLHLINAIHDADGIKLTASGNLPPKIVREIYSKKYILDRAIEAGITKLNQETKWLELHSAKIVLKLAKLVRVYGGKLQLTKTAQKLLVNDEYSDLFHLFFKTFTTGFNWAYNDAHEDEEISQIGFLYLLHLLNKHGKELREISFYSELYFKAFPVFLHQNQRFPGSHQFILSVRFFERFAEWFGFVEILGVENKYTEPLKVRKTNLLSHLFS